jgi:hypothetical protein
MTSQWNQPYQHQQPPPGEPYWPPMMRPGGPGPGGPSYGGQMPPPPRPPRRRGHRGLKILAGTAGAFVLLIVIAAIASSGPGTSPGTAAGPAATAAAKAAPPPPARKAAPQRVTYIVTGSPADVTYGPAGSDLSGTVPMRVHRPLGHPQYYSISAQLNGGGQVTCKILVDGKVISTATATGGYNIADCEISQDPFSGNWADTNSQ